MAEQTQPPPEMLTFAHRWHQPSTPSAKERQLERTIAQRMGRVATLTEPPVLNRLQDDLVELERLRKARTRFMDFSPWPWFQEDHKAINQRLLELTPPEFRLPLEPPLDVTALPGGYHLDEHGSDTKFALMPWNYMDLGKEWDRPDQLDPEALSAWLDKNCCSDWSKQDEHGVCFGGHWDAPEGSEARENAYEWSRRDNIKALCALPYPSRAIIWTVQRGCSTRQESVAFTVLCCEWFQRKRAQMKDVDPKVMQAFGESEDVLSGYPASMVSEMLSEAMERLSEALKDGTMVVTAPTDDDPKC